MRVKLAETAGFCMGVKRAVDGALAVSQKNARPIYTLGPLIHNQQVIDQLNGQGVTVCDDVESIDEGTVVIRAHGVPPETFELLEAGGLEVVDATCPHVLASQRAIRKHSSQNCQIIIAGDKDHAESIGLLGYCTGPGEIVSSVEDARRVELLDEVCLIAQTTFNETTYEEIADVIRSRLPGTLVLNTICKATQRRQDECRELAAEVDAMIVVGGAHSANTCRLAEIARSTGTPTYHIQTADDLTPSELKTFETVGVTAGASTPNWIIRSVIRRIERLGRRRASTRLLRRGIEFAVESNIYSGIAAMGLTYACHCLQQRPPDSDLRWFLIISFCYVFSVHIWHRLRRNANDPSATQRMAFFARNARMLTGLSVVLVVLSLSVAAALGLTTFLLLAVAYVIGIIYSVQVVPTRWEWLPYRRLQDIPASKDVFSAAAWATVAVLIPWLSVADGSLIAVGGAFVIAFAAGFTRTTMLDFTDVQADRLTGLDTLPTLIGTKKTLAVLTFAAGLIGVVLVGLTAVGEFLPLGYWLLVVPVYVIFYLRYLHDRLASDESVCVLAADGTLVLMGLIAYAWVHTAN